MSMKSMTMMPPIFRRRSWRATSAAASILVAVTVSSCDLLPVNRPVFTSMAHSDSASWMMMEPPLGSGTLMRRSSSISFSMWKALKMGVLLS